MEFQPDSTLPSYVLSTPAAWGDICELGQASKNSGCGCKWLVGWSGKVSENSCGSGMARWTKLEVQDHQPLVNKQFAMENGHL